MNLLSAFMVLLVVVEALVIKLHFFIIFDALTNIFGSLALE